MVSDTGFEQTLIIILGQYKLDYFHVWERGANVYLDIIHQVSVV